MIIHIDARDPDPVSLIESDDFTRFHITLAGDQEPRLPEIVDRCGLGRMTVDGDVAVRTDALRSLAGNRSPEWHRKLDSMLAHAASRGWMPDSDHVQAHCERVG